MKYKNYSIERHDEMNWTVKRTDQVTADRDIKAPKTGEIIHKQGDTYEKVVRLGYFSDVAAALTGIVKDLAGVNCQTIEELASQIGEIKRELADLLIIKA